MSLSSPTLDDFSCLAHLNRQGRLAHSTIPEYYQAIDTDHAVWMLLAAAARMVSKEAR